MSQKQQPEPEQKQPDKSPGQSGGGLFGGLLLGMLLSVAYVKFGWSLPDWVTPVESAAARATDLVVSLLVDRNDFGELQREISYRLYGDGYVALDNSVDGFITEELVWQARTKRSLFQLQTSLKAMAARRESGDYPALAGNLDRLIDTMPVERAAERLLLRRYLAQRFPGQDDAAVARQLVTLNLDELLQLPVPYARLYLSLPVAAHARVVILDADQQPLKTLLDSELPAGQLRLYWFFTDDRGQRVDTVPYRYQLWIAGELQREATLHEVGALWE